MRLAFAFAVFSLFAGAAQAGPLDGTWRGQYLCGQGATALTLVIAERAGGALTGEFRFSAAPENPGLPSGSFRVEGVNTGDGLMLSGREWIVQPPGYGMVALQGQLAPAGDRIDGAILFPGCIGFSVSRVAEATPVARPNPAPSRGAAPPRSTAPQPLVGANGPVR